MTGSKQTYCSIVPSEQRNFSERCHVLPPYRNLRNVISSKCRLTIPEEKGGSYMSMFSGKLLYHQEQNHFELNGIVLRPGKWIEINLMGHWISGQLDKDFTGWYFITSDQVGIRLRSGLIARFAQVPSSLLTEEEPHHPEPLNGEEQKLILLVEDDEVHASMLDQIFKQETPYLVHCAPDGQTAWEFLQEVKPQLIVLDYMLPQMSGLMLYDHIQAEEALQDIPVLMISAALPSQEVEQRGITSLQKPFEIDELLHTTKDLIASMKNHRDRA